MKLTSSLLLIALSGLAGIGCSREPAGGAPQDEPAPDVDLLRSLPYAGFSPRKASDRHGVVVLDRERSYPGYNLLSNRNLCLAELIDQRGRVVQTWTDSPCHHWSNAEMLPMGDVLVPGMDPLRSDDPREHLAARYLMRFAFDDELLWERRLPVHHDVELTPRNQLLTLTMGYRTIPAIHSSVEVRDNSLTLLSLNGDVIEELSLYDLFSADPENFPLQEVDLKKKKLEVDLFHANSVEWMRYKHLENKDPLYASTNVLVSIRHQDVIAVVNWDAKRLVWMWGRGEISGPHDATVLENGHIMVFDNGLARGWSRVIELNPLTQEIIWEYRAPNPEDLFTASRGANQRLPNGNTLITNSDNGQVIEVTGNGTIVWEFLNPHLNAEGHRASIVRLKRYERAFIDGLRDRHTK